MDFDNFSFEKYRLLPKVFTGINNKKPQVSVKGTEEFNAWGSHHPVEDFIGSQWN